MAFLSAWGIAHPEGVETTLRTVLPHVARSEDGPQVAFDVLASEAEVHRLRPAQIRKRDRRLYGDNLSIYVGTDERSLLFAVGGPGTEPLLTRWPGARLNEPSLLAIDWSFHPWIGLAERVNPDAKGLQELRRAFPTAADDGLRLRVTAQDRDIELTVEAEQGYLRLLGQVAGRSEENSD